MNPRLNGHKSCIPQFSDSLQKVSIMFDFIQESVGVIPPPPHSPLCLTVRYVFSLRILQSPGKVTHFSKGTGSPARFPKVGHRQIQAKIRDAAGFIPLRRSSKFFIKKKIPCAKSEKYTDSLSFCLFLQTLPITCGV